MSAAVAPILRVDPRRSLRDRETQDGIWVTVVSGMQEALNTPDARALALRYVLDKHGAQGAISQETPAAFDNGATIPFDGGAQERMDGSISADTYRHHAAVQTMASAGGGAGTVRYAKSFLVRRI